MATAEAAPASLGPRYAPDDPTLPKPWKGLIDGSTGLLYYWNPETNITQYEKPTALPTPLPAGPPPAVSTPKLAPIPVAHSVPPSGVGAQHGQQLLQPSHQQGQQVSHLSQQQTMPQQQSPQVAQVSQQQPSHVAQAGQQQSSQSVPSMPQPSFQQVRQQQMLQPVNQQMPQQQMHHQMPQQAMQSQHFGQGASQEHNSYMAQPQGHQFTHQNMHYMSYSHSMISSGQQSSQPIQHNTHGQPLENQQEFKAAFPNMEEVDYKNGKQVGLSTSQYQQKSALPVQNNQNISAGINSVQVPRVGVHAGQPQQFGGISGSMQQPSSAMHSQQSSSDLVYQHGHNFQNHMGPGVMHGQPSNVHPVDLKMGHEDNLHGRSGKEYYYNSSKDVPAMGSQQPNIAPIPISRNQQVFSFYQVSNLNHCHAFFIFY